VGVEVDVTRRLLAGERGAQDEFIHVFGRKVFLYSYLNCGRREDAEEVAQETLLKMLQHLGSLRDPTAVKTWAFQIARNTCFTRNRRSEFAPTEELSLETLPAHWLGTFRDEHPLPDDAAYLQELLMMIFAGRLLGWRV
jgi:DNA-directed RNA polymerase specialized sigma24 family protein